MPVLLTDFWHLADSVYLTSYLAGGALLSCWLYARGVWWWVVALAAVKAGGGGLFQVCYWLFRINK
ncbi:hypothetical protein GCM10027422_28920 [Hymenobacter arcticus]